MEADAAQLIKQLDEQIKSGDKSKDVKVKVTFATQCCNHGQAEQDETGENVDEEEYEESEGEEENDYIDSYFDNGEGDESDGGDGICKLF